MSPRRYQLGKRQDRIDESRRRVLDAARTLLAESASYTAFTVDAVAKKADVARATVYYQFGSKTGLLDAVCDDLAETGQMSELAGAFTDPDPRRGLRHFVVTFGRFWAADRPVMRRLRALAALDPEVGAVIAARDERRRDGLRVLIGRLASGGLLPASAGDAAEDADATGGGQPAANEAAARVLLALTSFETFDVLASPGRPLADVADEIIRLAGAALGLRAGPAGPASGRRASG
ncbi:MAG TPA: TetR/AcrR family transcriptional regulator [Streptosporangiaceae bacterium]|nr:TetR/AcrR family transcriptional regulator [Streptosporangiaceae bacterium]